MDRHAAFDGVKYPNSWQILRKYQNLARRPLKPGVIRKKNMNIVHEIKESWGWIGIDPEEIVGENEFGYLLVRDSQGKYWRLCPEDVYCEIIANSREELDQLSKNKEFIEDWQMKALVDQAREKLGPLDRGFKYCLVTPGVLGGEYAVSNIKISPLSELIRFSGDLAKQVKDLPEGTPIQIKTVD